MNDNESAVATSTEYIKAATDLLNFISSRAKKENRKFTKEEKFKIKELQDGVAQAQELAEEAFKRSNEKFDANR